MLSWGASHTELNSISRAVLRLIFCCSFWEWKNLFLWCAGYWGVLFVVGTFDICYSYHTWCMADSFLWLILFNYGHDLAHKYPDYGWSEFGFIVEPMTCCMYVLWSWSISIHERIVLYSFGYNPISFLRYVFGVAKMLGNGGIAFLWSMMISYPKCGENLFFGLTVQ
jgi:hypothetical protein